MPVGYRAPVTGKALIGFTAAALVALGMTSPSRATPITWELEGTVRLVETGSSSALAGSLGAPVAGRVTYDGSAVSMGGTAGGRFDGAVLGFRFAIGGLESAHQSLGCCFFDVDSDPASGSGSISVFGLFVGPSALFPSGAPVRLSLIADTSGVISDIGLPQAPPPLSALRAFSIADWSQPYFSAGTGFEIGSQGSDDGRLVVELTRLERVPEPELASLLAASLLALAALRRRAW